MIKVKVISFNIPLSSSVDLRFSYAPILKLVLYILTPTCGIPECGDRSAVGPQGASSRLTPHYRLCYWKGQLGEGLGLEKEKRKDKQFSE